MDAKFAEVGGRRSEVEAGHAVRAGRRGSHLVWASAHADRSATISRGLKPTLRRESARPPRTAFTLVELLVVITIIILLMGLLTPVIWNAIISAREGRIKAEIAMLDSAFKAYKEKYGSYPPSDFSNLTSTNSPQYIALANHLAKAFPRCYVPTEISDMVARKVNSPAKAVTFWLSGFSSDPEHPISGLPGGSNAANPPAPRLPAFIDFERTRLTFPDGGNNAACYCPADTPGTPYVYFASQSYYYPSGNSYVLASFGVANGQGGLGTVHPYASDPPVANQLPAFVQPNSFQIISAGLDNDYGGGGTANGPPTATSVAFFPSGTDSSNKNAYTVGDRDNLTNFSERNLGDSVPK